MTGLIIRDSAGTVYVDMTRRLSQTVGSYDTGGANGSIAIPNPPPGKIPFYIIVPLQDLQRELGKRPAVTLTPVGPYYIMSWAYSYATNGWGYFSANCRIYYGYY